MKAKSTAEALRAAHARYLTEDGATYAVLSAELGIAVSALHRRWERLGLLDDAHRAASGRRPNRRLSHARLLEAWQRYPATPLAQLAAELDLDPSALRRRWRSLRLLPADALAEWRSARDAR